MPSLGPAYTVQVQQHNSPSCLPDYQTHILIKTVIKAAPEVLLCFFFLSFLFLCGETRSRQFAGSRRFSSLELSGASNHGCLFPLCLCACVCVWSCCCCCCFCCCCYHHLPPSPPFSGLINKTASAAPSDPLPGSLSSSDQILMCDTELAH